MIDPVYVLLHVFCIEKVVIENLLLSSTAKSQQNGLRFSKSRLQAALRAVHTFEAMECQEFLHCCLTCNKPTPPTRWKAHRGVKKILHQRTEKPQTSIPKGILHNTEH